MASGMKKKNFVVHCIGVLVFGFCILCQVSYFVRCFVNYGEIAFPRYVVEFGGEFGNVRDQHQTPCHLFFFLFLSVCHLLLFHCLSYLLSRVPVFDKYLFYSSIPLPDIIRRIGIIFALSLYPLITPLLFFIKSWIVFSTLS